MTTKNILIGLGVIALIGGGIYLYKNKKAKPTTTKPAVKADTKVDTTVAPAAAPEATK